MNPASLNSTPVQVDTSNDSVIIKKLLVDIPGGKTLDVSGYTPDIIYAGQVIIEETATGNLKPLNVSNGAYVALPANHTYKGILVSTISKAKPMASVMLSGDVNEEAFKNLIGFEVPSAAKTALGSHILFTKD